MIKMRMALAAALCMGIAACASGPIYRPAQAPGGYGYRDTLLTSDQYRVSFSGDYGTARETVENFALFRAADLALSRGADYFRVASRETSPIVNQSHFGPTASVGYGFGFPYWGTDIGYGGGRGYVETRYETVLQIQLGPDLPKDAPNVYNALQVKQNLAPMVAAAQR
ncbi:MAG: hypothetical protein PF501_06860 [Salinisphaera sp.]|jgi:hypothetical protein|nr:hypothetical protein [Salinisphaera sp.]